MRIPAKSKPCIPFFVFVASCVLCCIRGVNGNSSGIDYSIRENWYTRYPKYPEYCSNDAQLTKRKVPPLKKYDDDGSNNNNLNIKTQLLQVTALIRHGARTPWNDHTCWSGWESQGWDCELKTLTAPPAPPEISHLEDEATEKVQLDGEGAMFLFEKNYDALTNSDSPQLHNLLNGTCQMGQLLLRGYVQELSNGRMLRDTYVREVDEDQDDIQDNMVLFDLNEEEYTETKPYEEPNLYYRADDDQRTIMSGQALLRGMFDDLLQEHSEQLGSQIDPTIVVHTADRAQDILSPNKNICPRLNDLYDEATNSDEYVTKYIKSDESQIMDKLMEDEYGGDFQIQAQDCLMTTICNDRTLPDLLDDYGREGRDLSSYGQDLFDRLNNYSFQPYTYVMGYNDAAYSKLAFGPLWAEILSNMLPHLPESAWKDTLPELKQGMHKSESVPKLAVFSGHDTTLLPILATLGSNVYNGEEWAPYASMVLIELHSILEPTAEIKEMFPTSTAFRLVYNGKILTDRVEGCTSNEELCDMIHLLNRVAPFTTRQRDCNWVSKDNLDTHIGDALFGSWRGIMTFLSIIIFSILIGSVVTYQVMMRGGLPSFCGGGRVGLRNYKKALSLTHDLSFETSSDRGLEANRSRYGASDSSSSMENSII